MTDTINSLATIRIKNLRLRAFIGINPDELEKAQDIVINARIIYDARNALSSASIDDALNYRDITKQIIRHVESSHFLLLEGMTADIVRLISTHEQVVHAEVEIDKPHALRFSDSVSITLSTRGIVAAAHPGITEVQAS